MRQLQTTNILALFNVTSGIYSIIYFQGQFRQEPLEILHNFGYKQYET